MMMQSSRTPAIIHTTLPNLRLLNLQGVSAYLEVLIHQIATPHLERLHIAFYDEHLTVSIPCLVQVMGAIENKKLRFDSAKFEFTDSRIRVVEIYPSRLFPLYELCRQFSFGINADCLHLNGHISSMAQIVDALGQVLSAVEHLILDYDEDSWFSDGDYEVEIDHTWLYKLFIPFSNVKNLRVNYRIVEEFSRYL